MSRKLQIGLAVVGAALGSVFLVAAIVCMFAGAPSHPTVGANGEVTGTVIPWTTVIAAILSLFGGSSFLAPYIAFFMKAKTVVEPILNTIPVQPVPSPAINNIPADTIEVLEAVRGFVATPKDIKAERRFVVAVFTELADLTVFQSPEVAAALAVLGQTVVKEWLPPAGAAK